MSTTRGTVDQAASSFICGTTAAFTTPIPLVASIVPCKRVRLIAPSTMSPAGTVNPGVVMFGSALVQNDSIAADGSGDKYIHVDDASKIYVSAAAASKLEYRIET